MDNLIKQSEPNSTATRTALWRALHTLNDAPPHIIEDLIGLKLISPLENWPDQPDMKYTQRLRASVVARARYVEDLVLAQYRKGVAQYAILGSGLDSFAQRHPELSERLQIFEMDQQATLAWKRRRLIEENIGIAKNLHFIPVNFETDSWWKELTKSAFDPRQKTIITCTGVTLYLAKTTIKETLRQIKSFASGSTVAMTFYLPADLVAGEDRLLLEMAIKGAAASGTPFISFFTPEEISAIAKEIGFKTFKTISTKEMKRLYFANRTDGLLPASGEFFLVATI